MRNEKKFEEVAPELVETTTVNIRRQMENNEDAIAALSAFAQPVRPLELVHPPRKVPTVIVFEVDPRFIREEIQASKRKKTARQLHWFDLVALFAVTGLSFVKLGLVDLAYLWT